jgi:hypothetical protein
MKKPAEAGQSAAKKKARQSEPVTKVWTKKNPL